MKVRTISYQRAFPIGPFLQEKIGFDADIDIEIEDGEAIKKAAALLKAAAEEVHKANNPQLYEESVRQVPIEKIMEDQLTGDLKEDMKSCKDIKTLESYRFLVKGNEELTELYNSRMAFLIAKINMND